MLHGFKVTSGKAYKSSKLFENTSGEFATFHLSAAVVEDASALKSTDKFGLAVKLEEKYGQQEITLTTLSKERDTVALDLYINCTQELSLSLKNAPKGCSVSLSGYFEPKGDDMEDGMFGYGDEDGEDLEDDDEGDDDSDEDENKGLVVKGKGIKDQKALTQSLSQAKQNADKNASSTRVHDEDLDSDDDDDEEDEEQSKDDAEDSEDDD